MVFTSTEFLLFFALVLILRTFTRTANSDKWLLLAASVAFYASWSTSSLVFIGLTAVVDFSVARAMAGGRENQARSKRLLWISLGTNLGLLIFFKYGRFILENLSAVLGIQGVAVGLERFQWGLPP